jgi:hypothetical protein
MLLHWKVLVPEEPNKFRNGAVKYRYGPEEYLAWHNNAFQRTGTGTKPNGFCNSDAVYQCGQKKKTFILFNRKILRGTGTGTQQNKIRSGALKYR